MRSGFRVVLAIVSFCLLAVPIFAQRQTRTVFIKAVDQAGAPVSGLTAADFEVKEGDASRTVTYAGPASGPMRLILLIDTGGNAGPFQGQLKDTLLAFINAIPEPHEIGIVSMGRQVRVRQAPITDRIKLRDAAGKITVDGGGILFFDAFRETESRLLKKEGVRWPVYVMFLTDGTEASQPIQGDEFQKMANDMFARGTSLHAMLVEKVGPTPITGIVANLVKSSGGMLEDVKVPATLPDKAKAMAARIASDIQAAEGRYQIEYTSDASYKGVVEAGVTKPGIRSTLSVRR